MQEHISFQNFPFNFLFEDWIVNGTIACLFTCIGIGCIALLFEGIRVFRVAVTKRFEAFPLIPIISSELTPVGSESPIINSLRVPASENHVRNSRIRNHISQTLIHVVRLIVSYFLMLGVMTYNAYITISIIGGATLGYFIFCHDLMRWRPAEICNKDSDSRINVPSSFSPRGDEGHPMLKAEQICCSVNDNIAEIKS